MKAIKATNIADHVMIGGPIKFDDKGQNNGIISAVVQNRDRTPTVVLPDGVATRRRCCQCRAGKAGLESAQAYVSGLAGPPGPAIAMNLAIVLNVIIQGVLTGLVYGLMALGLSVIFGVVRVVNFAHGEFAVVAMYAAYLLFATLGSRSADVAAFRSRGASSLIGFAAAGGAGQPFRRPARARAIHPAGRPRHHHRQRAADDVRSGCAADQPALYASTAMLIGPLFIDKARVYAAVGALLVAVGAVRLFPLHRTGTAIRACADNLTARSVVGLNVKRLYAVDLRHRARLRRRGRRADGDDRGSRCSLLSPAYTLLAFIIVIIGGLGSMAGALIGGVLIGVSEALAGFFFVPSMKSMFSFALLVAVLVLRPQGLMGRRA